MKRDFDKFIKERKGTRAHSFTIFEEEYSLPPTIPYAAVLEFTALQKKEKDEEIANDQLLELLSSLIGKRNVDRLITYVEFDMEMAIELMNYVLEVYGLKQKPQTAEELLAGNLKAVTDQVSS